jgi:phage terminase small subunit
MPRHRSAKPVTPKGARPLNPRKERFVGEYLFDLNGDKAAQRAGFAPRSARVTASRLLSQPHVIDALQGARDRHARRLEVTTARVLDELAARAFSNIADIWPAPGAIFEPPKLDRRLSAAIREVTIEDTIIRVKGGGEPMIRRRTKIKLHDNIRALESLGKHLGLFAEPKRDSIEERVKRMTPQERVARMDQILAEARRRYGHLLIEDGKDPG